MNLKKLLILTIFIFFILPFNISYAEENTAVCDLCGFCPSVDPTPPSNWQKCAKCLYPHIYGNEEPIPDGRTLQADPETGEPVTAKKGRYYSFLGCISTDFSSFQEEGAITSVVNSLSQTLFSIIGALSFIYLIYGAFILATSQSDPEKINQGKTIIKRAILGLLFSLFSIFIVKTIVRILGLPGFE